MDIASYAVTAALAGMGTQRRSEEQPLIPLALAAKGLADAAGAAFLTVEQLSKHRALCAWCLLAALASAAAVPQVFRQARLAWRYLRAAA